MFHPEDPGATQSVPPIAVSRLAVAVAFAVSLAACGGGGGGGGSNGGGGGGDPITNPTLTGEQQVALAAFGASASRDSAMTGADEAEDETETASTSGFVTSASQQVACDSGSQYVHENTGGEFALNQVGSFEATGVFANQDSLPAGNDSQLRADDCRSEADGLTFRTDGIADTAEASFGGDRGVFYTVAGGYGGSDTSVPSKNDRDLSAPFVSEFSGNGFDSSFRTRGEFWSCDGCLEETSGSFVADLGNVNGDPNRDVAVALSFEFAFDGQQFTFGNVDQGDLFKFVSRADSAGADAAEVFVNGRLSFADPEVPACNFDVTYAGDKSNPLFDPNFNSEDSIPTRGTLDVTVNTGSGAGDTFTVDFDTGDPDTVSVNGTVYDRFGLNDDLGCDATA